MPKPRPTKAKARAYLDEWVWTTIAQSDVEAKTGVRFAQPMNQRETPFLLRPK